MLLAVGDPAGPVTALLPFGSKPTRNTTAAKRQTPKTHTQGKRDLRTWGEMTLELHLGNEDIQYLKEMGVLRRLLQHEDTCLTGPPMSEKECDELNEMPGGLFGRLLA
jgi:hypothetical protein